MSDIMEDRIGNTVKINISGTVFQVKISTLQRFPNSRLSSLVDRNSSANEENEYYFDQDPSMFGYILRCCRSGEVHVPKHVCGHDFVKELDFWGIPLKKVSPCCLPTLYQPDISVEILRTLHIAELTKDSGGNSVLTMREKVWNFLNNPNYSLAAKVWFYCYLAVVMLSIVVYFLWMIPSLRVHRYLQGDLLQYNYSYEKIAEMVESDPHAVLFLFDVFCVFFFAVELIVRFAVCPRKFTFFKTWYNSLNLVVVITTMMGFIFELRKDLINNNTVGACYYVVKNFYLFRLLLLLRLEEQFEGLKILILSVKHSTNELLLLLFSLLMATCIFGGLMFCAEIHTSVYPDISIALWWALVTITTVGYGDRVPNDLPGRIIGSLCAVCGVMLLALPVAVIVANFAAFYGHHAYLRKHKVVAKKQHAESDSAFDETFNQPLSNKFRRAASF